MKTSKHTFFCNNLNDLNLPPDESHHAVGVLRLKSGNHINVTDGKGNFALVKIIEPSKKNLTFEIVEKFQQAKPTTNIHIAIAPTKSNDRIEFFLEKATEIGITEITPILSANSERKKINTERWEKILIAASKQSNNHHFPILNELTKLHDFIKENNSENTQYYIAHCEADKPRTELKDEQITQKNNCILIGPEGDFNLEEINLAITNKFKPVSLGKTRLRTETAGIVACHILNLIS
ncbi:16S rRNA (uracil(1498)-N(3))-methyltransferase [Putridiphycobacter roseus]|uniref:Ribosomal RNA small subunit methyltransferase E n=1 Tax=Putridiphycobacter roseus TaxID=2219161 RepID=A0A2W1MUH8_9FLAO|nr:16S rRNA (uracil(1498)-N(3))-methyltransferase [Putridiphycobacter roseus]PZE15719.1 16S rRNA (uracil(1498)-N(3))-methyltransferase [Putridiphycobacter roseus]